MGPEQTKPQQFYRYTDGEGRLHIVSSPDSLPPEARAKAQQIELNATHVRAEHVIAPSSPALSFELQGFSFALGFAAALVLALLFRFLPSSLRFVSRLAVVLGVAALGAGLYLGMIRKSTGAADSGALASPGALIQDAKDAVRKVEQRRRDQEAELRAIEAEAKGK